MSLYEPREGWEPYYEELDPKKRWAILQELDPEQSEELAIYRRLFQERYRDPKNPDRWVDTYLWKCVYLPGLYRKRRIPFSGFQREVEQTLRDLHLDAPERLTEEERRALYLEFRNAGWRYLSTCRSDRYASRLMGMKHATWPEKLRRATQDVWCMSRGLAKESNQQEKMELFCDALYCELLLFDPDSREIYQALENEQ